MKASLEWMSIAYQADFDVPLFDLAARSPEFQRSMYQAIRAYYPYALNLTDMHVSTNGIQAETGLRIKMFRGNASVNLTPGRLAMDFSDINRREDLDICKTCIDLVWRILFQTWTDIAALTDSIIVSFFLHADGAARHLEIVSANEFHVDPTLADATERNPVVAIDLGNSENGWRTTANVTVQTQDDLFVFCQTRYSVFTTPIAERVGKQLGLVDLILHGIEVEL